MVSVATLCGSHSRCSAVLVFFVSSLIHMLLGYHHSDFGRCLAEDEALDAAETPEPHARRLRAAEGPDPRPTRAEFAAKAKRIRW